MYVGHCLCAIQEDDQQTDHLTCDFSRNWLLDEIFAIQLTIVNRKFPISSCWNLPKGFWQKGWLWPSWRHHCIFSAQLSPPETKAKLNQGFLSWWHRSIDANNLQQKAHLSGEAHFYQIGNIRLFKWIPWSGLWLGWGCTRGAWGTCLRFGGVHALFGSWPGVTKRNIWPKCIMLHISY